MRTACGMKSDLYHHYPNPGSGGDHYVKCRSANTGHDGARGVRWNKELECFEMKCDRCYRNRSHNEGGYWPITTEFWSITDGLQQCLACVREHRRKMQARRRNKCQEPFEICRCGKIDGRQKTVKPVDFSYVPESELVA